MSKLVWNLTGNKFYESGVDKCVFYDENGDATAWNGVTSIIENNSDISESISFIDGTRYLNKVLFSNYKSTLSAYTYPDIFESYAGYDSLGNTYGKPKLFSFSYRTNVGNDINGIDNGYKIHIIYNAVARPSLSEYLSYGSEITPTVFSWEIDTIPIEVPNMSPTSHVIIDSTYTNPVVLGLIEDYLYGTVSDTAKLPTFSELYSIFNDNSYFSIIDYGDGSFSASGSDEYVKLIDSTTFELTSPSVKIISSDTYQASSL